MSGGPGSANHKENYELRKRLLGWYISNLDREMPAEYGDVAYEHQQEDGTKTILHRPMTRADILVMETMYSGAIKEVGMSNSDEHKAQRTHIAQQYLQKMSVDRAWGSVPFIVAFAHIWKQPCPVRIYQILNGKLVKYQDITPVGTSLPPEEEDDMLQEDDFTLSIPEAESNMEAWVPTDHNQEPAALQAPDAALQAPGAALQAPASDDVEMSDAMETEAVDQNFDQNFIRLLFDRDGPGHYDALATKAQRDLICAVFPRCRSDFVEF